MPMLPFDLPAAAVVRSKMLAEAKAATGGSAMADHLPYTGLGEVQCVGSAGRNMSYKERRKCRGLEILGSFTSTSTRTPHFTDEVYHIQHNGEQGRYFSIPAEARVRHATRNH